MQMQEEEEEEGDTDTDTVLYPVVQAVIHCKVVDQEYTVLIQVDTHLEEVVDIHKLEDDMDMDKENR